MKRQRGFTILEVLVGFLISALLLSVILSAFSSGMSGLSKTDSLSKAALVAQSRLFEVGVSTPLVAGAYQGEDRSGYRWSVEISPLAWEYAPALQEQGAALYRVTVQVIGRGDSRFELSSLRFATQEPGS